MSTDDPIEEPPGAPTTPPFAPPVAPPVAPPYQAPTYDQSGLVPQPDLPNFLLPPGVVLAPVGRRIGAYFLAIPLFIVTLGIGYIIWGLILWRQGTSPAFKVLKMWVVPQTGGTPVGFGRMALRNIVGGIVQGILSWITELISFILFLVRPLHQPLTDLVASTTVVHDPTGVYQQIKAGQAQ